MEDSSGATGTISKKTSASSSQTWTLTDEGYLLGPSGGILATNAGYIFTVQGGISNSNTHPYVCTQGDNVDTTYAGGPGTPLNCVATSGESTFYLCLPGMIEASSALCRMFYQPEGTQQIIKQLTIGPD